MFERIPDQEEHLNKCELVSGYVGSLYGAGWGGWGAGYAGVGYAGHGVAVRGPHTVPAVVAGPAGKIVADGLYGVPHHHY